MEGNGPGPATLETDFEPGQVQKMDVAPEKKKKKKMAVHKY